MSASIVLIYCAGGNKRNMQTAVDLGWHTGARSDDRVYDIHRPLYLLDCHWTQYDWTRHVRVTRTERPMLAAVPDVLSLDELPRALAQAEELGSYCDRLLIIPKVGGLIAQLPRLIAGRSVVLGFSVPTRYGATPVPAWEFSGWPVHLLGGTPRAQVRLAHYLDVVSADGNMAQKIANVGSVFTPTCGNAPLRTFMDDVTDDVPYTCFRLSLIHIRGYWARHGFTIVPRQREVPA